jgi:hypothetical protein
MCLAKKEYTFLHTSRIEKRARAFFFANKWVPPIHFQIERYAKEKDPLCNHSKHKKEVLTDIE